MSAAEIAAVSLDDMLATGLTYRQIDYWCRQGYLRPLEATPGSGKARVWLSTERDVALLINRLLGVGVELQAAVQVARSVAESDTKRVDLGEGVVISIESKSAPKPPVAARRRATRTVRPRWVRLRRARLRGAA